MSAPSPFLSSPGMSSPGLSSPGSLTPVAASPISFTIPNINSPVTSSLPPLPSINPSQKLPSLQTAPTLQPSTPTPTPVSLPSINLSNYGTLGGYLSTYLADNETGELIWRRPNPPQPVSPNSAYRRIGCIGDGSCFFHAVAKGLSKLYRQSYTEYKSIDEKTLQEYEQSVSNKIKFYDNLFDRPRVPDLNAIYNIKPSMIPTFNMIMNNFRTQYAQIFRQDFANRLRTDPKMEQLFRTRLSGYIESIANEPGYYEMIKNSKNPSETAYLLAKEILIKELLSGNAVQPDFMVLLSDYLNVDIYLLRDKDLLDPNPKNNPLYGGEQLHAAVRGPADMRKVQTAEPNRTAIVIISHGDGHYEIVGRVDQIITDQKVTRANTTNFVQEEPLIRRLYDILKNSENR